MSKQKETSLPIEVTNHFSERPPHPDIRLTNSGILGVRDHAARSDEPQFKEITLHQFWLPENTVYTVGMKLIEVPHLIITAIEAINFAVRASRDSKSKANRIFMLFRSIVKYIEYAWLNDMYDLGQIPKRFSDELPHLLADGGWHLALQIEDRLINYLDSATDQSHPIFRSTNDVTSVNSRAFQESIHTNINGREVTIYFNILKDFQLEKGWINSNQYIKKDNPTNLGMKYSMLKSTLEAINYLTYVNELSGSAIPPFPDYVRLSKKITEAPGHTRNIDGASAGIILESSLFFLYENASIAIDILKYAAVELENYKNPTNADRRQFYKKISSIANACGFDEKTGNVYKLYKISQLSTLNNISRDIYTCCFILIAVFNARRKDEIIHKKFGLYFGSCTTYNERLKVFELMIYIEKTIKGYAPFYVGDVTKHAVSTLENLQELFFNLSAVEKDKNKANRELTLFRYKNFTWEGLSETPSYYNFEATPKGQSYRFLSEFVGLDMPIRVSPHMFRKLYCTIFINQHEYPNLPALSQQLRHGELSTTQIYITSPIMQKQAGSLSKVYDWNINEYDTLHTAHNEAILEDLQTARHEKLSEIIYSILNGQKTSGGYKKLVTYIFKKFNKSIEFANLDDNHKIKLITEKLKSRGHSPSPFSHSQCLAGSTKIRSRSKCWDKSDDLLHKENASPSLCAKCPFSSTSEAHLSNMKADALYLDANLRELEPNSINWINKNKELMNLRSIIEFHNINLTERHL